MKINDKKDADFKTNMEGTKSYTIKAGAKAFAVLSSQLYKNPIRAIIRELSCNAMDAHRAAGNQRPFKVFLPNAFSDEFAIEDRGVGMSPEEMDKIYHTYFESTKESSDEDIGGFGIGSKTPFSYTSMFNVRSVKNGVETVSMSFLDAEKIPQYSLIGVGETSDPNGTRVSFTVKKEDYEKFYKESVAVFAFLPYLPEIVSGKEEVQSYLPMVGDGREWSDYEAIRASIVAGAPTEEAVTLVTNVVGGDSCILMGGVPYRFDAYEAFKNDKAISESEISRIKRLFHIKVVTPVKIGDVVVQPSREELSYEAKTIETAKRVFGGLFKSFFDDLLASKNLYEKIAACRKNRWLIEFLSNHNVSLNRTIKLNGKSVDFSGLENILGSSIFTYEVSKALVRLMDDATDFNLSLHTLSSSSGLFSAVSQNNFHVPIVKIESNGSLKVVECRVGIPRYSWHKNWTVAELYDKMADGVAYTCRKEFWDSNFRREPLNVDSKAWTNTKRKVIERTETLWRSRLFSIVVVNPANLDLLEANGFPKLPDFEEIDKFEYKVEKKTTKFTELEDAKVEVLFSTKSLSHNASIFNGTATYRELAAEASKLKLKIAWAISEKCKSYYSNREFLFLAPSYGKENASRENTRHISYGETFFSNLAEVSKLLGSTAMNDLVVISVAYGDVKKAKLYEDMSDSFQSLVERLSEEIFEKVKAAAEKFMVSKEMIFFTNVRKIVKTKRAAGHRGEFEKSLDGVENYEPNNHKFVSVKDDLIRLVPRPLEPGYMTDTAPKLKEKLFQAYPMIRFAERATFSLNSEGVEKTVADYIVEKDGLPLASGAKVVATPTVVDEEKLKAIA